MNIRELKEKIENLPNHMDVFFMAETDQEFKYGLVNSAQVKEIGCSEEPGGKVLAHVQVLVLSEE